MRKLLYLFALIIPLSAQEVKEEVENKEPKQCCVQKESTGKKSDDASPFWVVRTLQDMEWRKFEAAHRRAHSKRGEYAGRESRGDKHKIRQLVRLVVVGGIGYYIGLNEGKKHWDKRIEYKGDRP